MSSIISKEILSKLEYSFPGEDVTRFGLLDNGWLVLLINGKTTSEGFDRLIHLTGCEIVKVHVREKWTTTSVVAGQDYYASNTTAVVDHRMANRMERVALNTPFEVNVSGNIPEKLEFTEQRTFIVSNGNVVPGFSRLKSHELTTMAKILRAQLFVANVKVEQVVTNKVSQYRSVPISF